ncbi:MAG: Smr/MutS family protein [Bacteroidales bacterium]|nr:Smr/MutS family protein [Bacteroidales bacterium]
MIYPNNFEDKTGFTTIRKMLRQFCVSTMGREKADIIAFSADIHSISESLDETESMVQLIDQGLPFPVRDYFDLRPELKRLRIDGTVIELESLFDLRLSLNILNQILQFTSSPQSINFLPVRNLARDLFIDKLLLKEVNRLIDDKGVIPDNASETLANIRQDIRRKQGTIERKIRQMLGEAKHSGWSDSDTEVTIRNGRMVIPVRAADKRKIRGFIHDESATGQTVYIEPAEVFDTNNEIRELEYAEKREIHRILTAFTQLLRPHLPMMSDAWEFLGNIDLCHAKALLTKKINASKPVLVDKAVIDWKQAIHPLLEISLREQKKQAVPLDLHLHAEERILVISGPNAGGKSVCLKTTGLLQYMLQCGLPIPLKAESICGIFSKMFIDIGDEQSLENDLSTYSSHLLHMKNFLEQADSSTLFMIDEFGTGTEPQSGGAIAEAVLEELNIRKAFGLITTHYANLKLLADRADGIINGAMLFDTKRLQPLYVLQTGKPGSSFAFEIARKTGLPESVLEKASEITGFSQLNFEQQLQQLEIEKIEVDRKQIELRVADNLLNDVIEKYKRLLKQLEDRKKNLLSEAGREAQTLIDKANKKIELTIKEIRESQAEKEKTKLLREQLQALKPEILKEAGEIAEAIQVLEENEEESFLELKPGDQVRIDEMDVVGELLSINEHEAVIGFNSVKLRTSPEKLTKLSRKEARLEEKRQPQRRRSALSEDINEKATQFRLTVDVRGKRAEEALELVGKYIDESVLLSVKDVNILHGKGNGILRRVIREFLSRTKEVATFEDAPVEAGGNGITRVKLK